VVVVALGGQLAAAAAAADVAVAAVAAAAAAAAAAPAAAAPRQKALLPGVSSLRLLSLSQLLPRLRRPASRAASVVGLRRARLAPRSAAAGAARAGTTAALDR
jgi:hypothetical protein